jgi:hypothetical protein
MKPAARSILSILALLAFVPAISARNSKELDATPQAKAYRAQLKAVSDGDWDAYKQATARAAANEDEKMMTELKKTPKDTLRMIGMMAPKEVTFTGLEVNGSKAVLHAKGMMDGEMNTGKIELVREDGQWKVGKQSWTNAK